MRAVRARSCLLLAGLSLACDATCLRDSDCAGGRLCVADRCVLPRADGGVPEAGAGAQTEGPPSSSLPDARPVTRPDPLDAGRLAPPSDAGPGSDAESPAPAGPDADADTAS